MARSAHVVAANPPPPLASQIEVVETVAQIAFSETTNPTSHEDMEDAESELCTGALDKLTLQTSIRMDPDLHQVFRPLQPAPQEEPGAGARAGDDEAAGK